MFNVKKLIAVFFVVCFAFAYTVPVHAVTNVDDWSVSYSKTVSVYRYSTSHTSHMYYCADGYYFSCSSATISPSNAGKTVVKCTNYSMTDVEFAGSLAPVWRRVIVQGTVRSVDISFTPVIDSLAANISFQMSGQVWTATN